MNNTINPYNHYLLTVSIWNEYELTAIEHNLSVYHDKDTANKICEQLNTKYADNMGIMFEVTPIPEFNSIDILCKAVDIKLSNNK